MSLYLIHCIFIFFCKFKDDEQRHLGSCNMDTIPYVG